MVKFRRQYIQFSILVGFFALSPYLANVGGGGSFPSSMICAHTHKIVNSAIIVQLVYQSLSNSGFSLGITTKFKI